VTALERVARRCLIVFARVPRLLAVKTRLAASIGPEQALAAHRALLRRTLAVAAAARADSRWLQFAGTDEDQACAQLGAEFGLRVSPQPDGDLGERMAVALDQALDSHERAVLIGSDCPVLRPADLVEAFEALGSADLVLSPAEDGGYAMIGVARIGLPVFSQVDWGSDRVLRQTLAQAASAGLRVRQLRTVWDVDTVDDWKRWQALPEQAA
jgi:rSAM/selenodomain-associated transferase 1